MSTKVANCVIIVCSFKRLIYGLFAGFVDSAVIDSTEPATTEDLGLEDTTILPSSTTVHSSIKKKVLSPQEPKKESEESSKSKSKSEPVSTTEGWIIVASVQTSRSVSGARFIPSSAIKQEQHPLPLDAKSIKDVKAHINEKKNQSDSVASESSTAKATSLVTNTTAKASSTLSTESIIDKLDQVGDGVVRFYAMWKIFIVIEVMKKLNLIFNSENDVRTKNVMKNFHINLFKIHIYVFICNSQTIIQNT